MELSGSFDHDPQRRRPNEPQDARPLGDPPERLPVEARAFWNELVAIIAPGVLKVSDRWALEMAARIMCKIVNGPNVPAILELARTADLSQSEIKALISQESVSAPEWSFLSRLYSGFGLTPADRSRLSVPTEKPKNKFEALAAQATTARAIQ